MTPPGDARSDRSCGEERGVALVFTLMALTVMLALGSALTMLGIAETRISTYQSFGAETRLAAEGALAHAIEELKALPDWSPALRGDVSSSLRDGSPDAIRTLGGSTIDLAADTNRLRCGKPAPCTAGEVAAASAERPWGNDNPHWQLYAWGQLPVAGPTPRGRSVYVAVWVADDQADEDGNPLEDGAEPENPGAGAIRIVARGYGAAETTRTFEAVLSRRAPGRVTGSEETSGAEPAGGELVPGTDAGVTLDGPARLVSFREAPG